MDRKELEKIAKTLDITIEEAKEMLEEDKKIDRMKVSAVNNDMSTEQKKAIKKYTNVARGREIQCADAYGKKKKRTIKADDVKQMLIKLIAETLENSSEVDEVNITNIQKTITLKIGDDDFEIDLKRKRKPKA